MLLSKRLKCPVHIIKKAFKIGKIIIVKSLILGVLYFWVVLKWCIIESGANVSKLVFLEK
jgi:hypothetical protein